MSKRTVSKYFISYHGGKYCFRLVHAGWYTCSPPRAGSGTSLYRELFFQTIDEKKEHLPLPLRICKHARIPNVLLLYVRGPPQRNASGPRERTRHPSPGGVEGMAEGRHLVQDAPKGPYVRLVVVRLVVEQLGRHVVRRPDARAREVHRAFEYLIHIVNNCKFFVCFCFLGRGAFCTVCVGVKNVFRAKDDFRSHSGRVAASLSCWRSG